MALPPLSNRTSFDVIHAARSARERETQMIAVHNANRRRSQLAAILTKSPSILLQAVVVPGAKTSEGQIIEAVAIPWFKIVDLMQRDPSAIYQLDWRKWEEIIAGAYKEQGFDVVLTPRSNDKGRDIIASSRGVGSIRYFDQVKAYGPGHLVSADDVRAMIGVLTLEGNVSKGIVTTTSEFAPGVLADESVKKLVPYRLELKSQYALLDWLRTIASGRKQT